MPINETSLERVLQDVRFSGGLSASVMKGEFGAARFTRDYLAMMSNLMDTHPNIVREGFSMIPQEQGIDFDPLTDQQPDRLPHQVAYNQWSGLVIPGHIIDERQNLTEQWGIPFDEEKGFIVWNQTDASRYVHELATFVSKHGYDVLNDHFLHQPTGEIRTVRDATLRQLDWMVRTIDDSDLGLLEVAESNPKQTSWSGVMRDGYDSYFHETESGLRIPVNKDKPIAYLESQGLAIQAFHDALKLFENCDDSAILQRMDKWQEMLQELPDRVFEHFRWDEENSWVPAVDRDEQDRPRKVYNLNSVIGETLATPELYAGIRDKTIDRQHIIHNIVRTLFSYEFMTEVGPRTLALRHFASEGPVAAYQGPRSAWAVIGERFAQGLESTKNFHLAYHQRSERLLGGLALIPDEYPEIWPVTADGEVGYRYANDNDRDPLEFLAEQVPSKGQGWTLTAAIKAANMSKPTGKMTKFEKNVLEGIKDIPPASQRTPNKVRTYTIDTDEAKRIKDAEQNE